MTLQHSVMWSKQPGLALSGEPVMVQVTVMLRAQRMMKTGGIGWLQEGFDLFDNPVHNTPYDCMVLWALTCQVL